MTILLIIAAWTLILLLVTGLCAAARLGDRDQRVRAAVAIDWETSGRSPIAVHANEQVPITAHANAGVRRPSESGALASASLAA